MTEEAFLMERYHLAMARIREIPGEYERKGRIIVLDGMDYYGWTFSPNCQIG